MITKTQRPIIFSLSVVMSVILLHSGMAMAHKGATGIVKERMLMMKSMGDDMKTVGAMIKGQEPFDAAKIGAYAQSISVSSPDIPGLFPEAPIEDPSEALPSIWEEWEEFQALTDKLEVEAKKLQDVADKGDKRQIVMQFAKVGKVCSGCHTDFRKKKEDE